MERFKPQIEAFLASLPEGAVAQLSFFCPDGADKQVLALVLSDDAIATQAGIDTIEDGLRAQQDKRVQGILNPLTNNDHADEVVQRFNPTL